MAASGEEIRSLYRKLGSMVSVAEVLGIPVTKARYHISRSKEAKGPATAEEDPIKKRRQKTEQDAKRKEHIDAVNELAFRDFLKDLIEENVHSLPPVARRGNSARKAGRHERFPLAILSDWHFEEGVKSSGVMGLNEYSIPIACRRVYRVIHSAIAWKRDMEAAGRYHFPTLQVALLGDMLTGTLHGLERHSGAPNIVRAVLACGDLIALALRDLASEFEAVNVVGVAGNHGRLPDDRKVPTKDPTRSWDYMAYEIARRRLGDQENITWDLPDSYGALFEVGGHLCYGAHGNFIPNQLGIVGYGVRRFASALAGNLNAAGHRLKYCYLGHWHQQSSAEFAGLNTFICPSLIGAQEYTFLAGGAVNRPAQELFVMDEKLGLVSRETLYGDGPCDGTYEVNI